MEERELHASVSFIVRVRPSEDGVLRGSAKRVETGEEAYFDSPEALQSLLCQIAGLPTSIGPGGDGRKR